ncbi:MAG: hypothetical protein CUN53_04960 [Phototrophicales bacterium]|nr:MAG: hypothetical protein CUN53_04960 [Phototrophicales bacterium]
MPYRVSNHAREEAQRRGIPMELIQQVMASPGQIVAAHRGRNAYQSKVEIDGALYLVRIIVELGDPTSIITVYRTSKIEKYWSSDE